MGKTQTAKARDAALKVAIRAADVDAVRRALAAGASVKATSHGCFALGLAVFAFVYVASGTRPHDADVIGWLTEGKQALHSPPVLARLRGLPLE